MINDSVVREARLDRDDMAVVEDKQRAEVQRRSEHFCRGRDRIALTGRTAVIVDDGIATGATARAACQVARARGASRVVLAVPIGPDDIVARCAGYADEVVCLRTPTFFFPVGQVWSGTGFFRCFARCRDGRDKTPSRSRRGSQ